MRALSLSDRVLGATPQALLPPPGFTFIERPTQVYLAKNPHPHRSRATGAQKAGLAYEKKAKRWLQERFGEGRIVSGQWFYALDAMRKRYAQPDVLVFPLGGVAERPDEVTIVEIKTSYCALAWWQLARLYAPIVGKFYQPRRTRLVCLTRTLDPLVHTPEEPVLLDDLESPLEEGRVGVFLWRP